MTLIHPSQSSNTVPRCQDAFHPSFRYETRDPREDWKTSALRGPGLPVLGNAVAGAVGSAISNVIVYPLNVIVARLQTQAKKQKSEDGSEDEPEYTDILDAARKIYEQEGLAGFYPGLAQDTWKSVADSFLFFLAYNTVRQRRIRQPRARISFYPSGMNSRSAWSPVHSRSYSRLPCRILSLVNRPQRERAARTFRRRRLLLRFALRREFPGSGLGTRPLWFSRSTHRSLSSSMRCLNTYSSHARSASGPRLRSRSYWRL